MLRANRLSCQILSGNLFFTQHERRYTDSVVTLLSRWRNLSSSLFSDHQIFGFSCHSLPLLGQVSNLKGSLSLYGTIWFTFLNITDQKVRSGRDRRTSSRSGKQCHWIHISLTCIPNAKIWYRLYNDVQHSGGSSDIGGLSRLCTERSVKMIAPTDFSDFHRLAVGLPT